METRGQAFVFIYENCLFNISPLICSNIANSLSKPWLSVSQLSFILIYCNS